METWERLTLDETQLKLLCNIQNYAILAHFKEPRNPSEAARALGIPANVVHYRVNRLAAAGLLKAVARQGRRRSYQLVGCHFRIPRALLGALHEAQPASSEAFLNRLKKHYDPSEGLQVAA